MRFTRLAVNAAATCSSSLNPLPRSRGRGQGEGAHPKRTASPHATATRKKRVAPHTKELGIAGPLSIHRGIKGCATCASTVLHQGRRRLRVLHPLHLNLRPIRAALCQRCTHPMDHIHIGQPPQRRTQIALYRNRPGGVVAQHPMIDPSRLAATAHLSPRALEPSPRSRGRGQGEGATQREHPRPTQRLPAKSALSLTQMSPASPDPFPFTAASTAAPPAHPRFASRAKAPARSAFPVPESATNPRCSVPAVYSPHGPHPRRPAAAAANADSLALQSPGWRRRSAPHDRSAPTPSAWPPPHT